MATEPVAVAVSGLELGEVGKSLFFDAVVVAEAEKDVADAGLGGEANGVEAHCWS